MRYVQLRAFHNVAIHRGFSRAAEAMFLTQPAVSDQVRKLEEEYDVLLFDRSRKQVTLTAAGRDLLEITLRMFDREQQALELLSESRTLRSGTLRIVADSAHHLLHILGPFREKFPGIQITVAAGNTETVLRGLYSYEADIGVLGNLPEGRDYEILHLNSTPVAGFVSKDYPLAKAGRITVNDLVSHPLIMRESGSKTRQKIETFAARNKIELKPAIIAEGREAVREIVAVGTGIGFVSAAEFGSDDRLVLLPIEGCDLHMEEALVCLKDRREGKLVRAFWVIALSLPQPGAAGS